VKVGRPLINCFDELPKQRDLLLPESINPDKDLRLAERSRPSPEQVLVQKRVDLAATLLRSCMNNMPFDRKSVVLVVSLIGYIEDLGCAVVKYKMEDPSNRDLPLHPDNLFYLSVHQDQTNHEYGKKRVQQELVQLWLDQKLAVGVKRDASPPELTAEDTAAVPGGDIAMGNVQERARYLTKKPIVARMG